MRFDDAFFLFQFLPALLTAYFLVIEAYTFSRIPESWSAAAGLCLLTGASILLVSRIPYGSTLIAVAAVTYLASIIASSLTRGGREWAAHLVVAITIAAIFGAFVYIRLQMPGPLFAFAGAAVVCGHAVTYLIDLSRRRAAVQSPLIAGLYLLQFPLLPAGPLVRYDDFASHHLRLQHLVGLGAFAYGTRRIFMGLVKVVLVAGTLAEPVNAIFAMPASRLGPGAAWLGAIAFSLQIYLQFSGYADLAIGIGRMLGLRYPENFRRPYLADSVREFWRSWNITAVTWLRDYFALPIAGRDRPTLRHLISLLLGFMLLAVWHGATGNVLLWAVYSVVWLALEALGLGAIIERLPKPVRHVYLLVVVIFGWVILRADDGMAVLEYGAAMVGVHGPSFVPASRYLTLGVWIALIVGFVGSGPLVPWINRWRVTVDASTTAMMMMLAAVAVYFWQKTMRMIGLGRMIGSRRY